MSMEQTLVINITTGKLVIGIVAFLLGILVFVWKVKIEVIKAIQNGLGGLRDNPRN